MSQISSQGALENTKPNRAKFSNFEIFSSNLKQNPNDESNFNEDFDFSLLSSYKCSNHQESLEFFCFTCEEPICLMCMKLGPHHNKLHQCISLKEAVEKRKSFIIEILSSDFDGKIRKLLDHMQALRSKGEEISTVENVIENDIHFEFNGIIDRLQAQAGLKVSILQKEISFLQRDINNIDDLIAGFSEVLHRKDPIDFLLVNKELFQSAENLAVKNFKRKIEVYPYDLPRETSDLKTQMKNQTTLKLLSKFKDDVIVKAIKKIKDDEALTIKELIPDKLLELDGWVRLAEKFCREFEEIQLVCYYCSEIMTEDNINSICFINRLDFEMPKNCKK